MGAWTGTHFALGNPNPPSLYSEILLPYQGHMTFSERFQTTLYYLWSRYFLTFEGYPKSDFIIKKYLGNNLPYITDIEKNMSLLFLTTNPILYVPRPVVPTVISLEQTHVKQVKSLPEVLNIFTILQNFNQVLAGSSKSSGFFRTRNYSLQSWV